MSEDSKEGEKNEIAVVGGGEVLDPTRLTSKHFDYLEEVIDRLHHYQYQHVRKASLKEIAIWLSVYLSAFVIWVNIFANNNFRDGFFNIVKMLLIMGLTIGFFSLFSRCFTRLYHFRATTLRTAQVFTIVGVFQFLEIFLLYFNNIIPVFESWLCVFFVLLIIAGVYYGFDLVVPTKRRRLARIVYVVVSLSLFSFLMLQDPVRMYVFRDKDLWIYSDFGAGSAKDLGELDSMIDGLVEDLRD